MKVFFVVNFKGGFGKSMLVINFVGYFVLWWYDVMFGDIDC